ncbi:MAG TPA: hypothetical protein VG820_05425 [Fimbriimonadaceae bacterium]|nr:hypothetical protein [Fimbriimonadaceae bacterium]
MYALILAGLVTTSLKTASAHPMKYYLSLPDGWQAGKKWPVVVVIESANRDFETTAKEFERARGSKPFILVTPLVLTNGGPRYREATGYRYDAATWARIERDGTWKFDGAGVQAVLADVRRLYGGESKAFLTGWEAGGHTVFALAFTHPSWFAAAAPVCPNYAARWIAPAGERAAGMPLRCFIGAKDDLWQRFSSQWDRARNEARSRGFGDLSIRQVDGKGHEPLADAVLAWFLSLAGK